MELCWKSKNTYKIKKFKILKKQKIIKEIN